MKWFYAAYKMGSMKKMPEGLTPEEFRQWAVRDMASFDGAFVLQKKERPVGAMFAMAQDHRVEPHAFWFPWASARDKLEGVVAFVALFHFQIESANAVHAPVLRGRNQVIAGVNDGASPIDYGDRGANRRHVGIHAGARASCA